MAVLAEIPDGRALEEKIGGAGRAAWDAFCAEIEPNYDMDRIWSDGGKKWDWEYKYRRGGKTLCALYAAQDRFGLMIIFGGEERDKFEAIRDALSSETRAAYDAAATYHDGKWVMFSERLPLADLRKMLLIKRKPNKKGVKPTGKEAREEIQRIRERYPSYKVASLAERLYLEGVREEDAAYILEGGESVGIKPYDAAQAYLSRAMDRLEERIPPEKAQEMRRSDACCLGGLRDKLAREIYKNNPDIESRFAALSKERRIIGGKAWKEGGDYYISYWYEKPAEGYGCACLRCVPKSKPMNRLWCECCAGHILHHFQTALGAKAECRLISSALSSCGEEPCLFRFHVREKSDV